MLLLIFYIGKERYAIDCRQVVEIVPRVDLKMIPGAPDYVAGLFHYRGSIVPVIDLSQFTERRPAFDLLSTRVIVLHYSASNGTTLLLGMIAERVTETITRNESEFSNPVVHMDETKFLGKTSADDHGILQLVQVEHLLPEALRNSLIAGAV